MADTLLIAALSGRPLAAAARRAGFLPLVADFFGDSDTRRLAAASTIVAGGLSEGLDPGSLWDALDKLIEQASTPPAGLVWGAGFEDRPSLLAALAKRVPVLGNGPAQVRAVKEARRFFPLLDELAIPHPPVRFAPPEMTRGWLVKRSGASGGSHVRFARPRDEAATDRYFQQKLSGEAVSVQFLADGRRALLLGWARQHCEPAGRRAPFRFGGLAGPLTLPAPLVAPAGDWLSRLVEATGLVGLNSADFIVARDGLRLLEINPRPGAALDVFDLEGSAPLLALHVGACHGEMPDRWRGPSAARAASIIYARRGLRVPRGFAWPRWTADRGAPGTVLPRGAPVCSVLTQGDTPEAAWERASERAEAIHATLAAATPSRREREVRRRRQEVGLRG